jgi:hypothetical protein
MTHIPEFLIFIGLQQKDPFRENIPLKAYQHPKKVINLYNTLFILLLQQM